MLPLLCILLVAFTGFCEGVGVLPDGPLEKAVGGSVVFNTTNIGAKPPFTLVNWLFGSKTILISQPSGDTISPDYEGRVTYYSSTVSLELRGLTEADSGEYGVQIVSGAGFEEGRTNLVVIEGVSDLRVDPVSVDMVEFSGPVSLTCSSSGSLLSYVWMKDNSEVTASDRVQITDGGTKLTITNVTREDDGEYYCIVSNPVSSDSSNRVNITINYGPENIKLTLPNPVKPVEVGSDINMECSAESRPSAEFTWFVNETLLPDVGPKLKLTNVITAQSGSYSCQAFNPKTKKNQTSEPLQITILAELPDPPQSACGAGCIAGIVIAVIVVIVVAAGVGYYFYQKRSKTTKSTNTNTPTVPSGARDNAANTPDVNYADIRSFQKKSGERINLGQREPATIYSDVKVNNNPPAAPSLPTYDSHMQRQRTAGPTYAQVQKNRMQ